MKCADNQNSMNVIFDTNAYRYLAGNRSADEVSQVILAIRQEERRQGIRASMAPPVSLELFNHFEDEKDPHFSQCLVALVGSYLHTHDLDQGVVPYMAPNLTMLTSLALFGVRDPEEEAVVKQMDDIASVIYLDPRPASIIRLKDKFISYWNLIRKEEDQF